MKPPATIYYVRFGGKKPEVVGQRIAEGATPGDALAKKAQKGVKKENEVTGRSMSSTYSRREVSRLFGISEGRLRYWDHSGFLSPSGTRGRRRSYTFQDLVGIRSAKTLLDRGVSLQRARRIVSSLREKLPTSTRPLEHLRVLSDSKTVIVVDREREFEAESGQLLLDFQIADLKKEVVSELPRQSKGIPERTAYEWYLEGCRLDEDETTLSKAEAAYLKAINLDPTLANAYTNLGNLRYRSGAVEDAKALYEKAIEVDTNQPEAHYNLGFVMFESSQLQDAERCFSRAVELDATFADAHFNMAITLLRLGRIEAAHEYLLNYLRIEPTGPWADIARKRLQEIT